MFDLISKMLARKTYEPAPVKAPNDTRTHIASCVILLEAAYSDHECTTDEISHVMDTVKSTFGLSHEYAEEIMRLSENERETALDLWQFVKTINQDFSREEKQGVMEAVWRIIYADGHLGGHEDHFAHKLTQPLRLSHNDMIEAKLRAKKKPDGK